MLKRTLAAAALLLAMPAMAEPTEVHVRVLSQGAKFIGSSMGGVEILLRDAHTGAILASGRTEGSTGDTTKIMQGGARNAPVSTPDAGVFRATLDLDEPRLVEMQARGPLAQPQAALTVTSQRWIIPGVDVTMGDGWLVEMPGLAVDAIEPAQHEVVKPGTATRRVAANVSFQCGCPITPGGLWDAARITVTAHVRRQDGAVRRIGLPYAGRTGYFAADVPLDGPGSYVVTVTAVDRQTGATGVDRTSFILP